MLFAHARRYRRSGHGDQKVAQAINPLVEMLEQRRLLTTVDFDVDGLGANTSSGQIIDSEYANLGLTITTNSPAAHPAMIFNSSNPSGGDTDLGTPNQDFAGPGIGAGGESGQPGENNTAQGRILIISEDADQSDPDDNANGGTIIFTFANPVDISSLAVIDIENSSSNVKAFGAGNVLLSTTPMLNLGNNSFQTVNVNTAAVTRVEVFFAGSGGIPYLIFNDQQPPPPPPGNEGFTPGFWKSHTSAWVGFAPNQTLESVFNVPDSLGLDNTTLLAALDLGGGSGVQGASQKLLSHAVAALLNSAHPNVDYPLTTADVISMVNAALASNDKDTIEDLKDELVAFNQLGGSI